MTGTCFHRDMSRMNHGMMEAEQAADQKVSAGLKFKEGVVKQMSETAGNNGNSKKKNKAVILIAAVFAVVVIVLLGVIIYLLGRGSDNGNDDSRRETAGSVRTVIDEGSADDIMDQMREEVAEGMFECQMSMSWTFADGQAESQDAYVANSTNNTHPICFDVYLRDTEELIYSSPVLTVGSELRNIKLDKELPAGEYQATVMYTLLEDVEDQNEISQAGFVVTIKVLN